MKLVVSLSRVLLAVALGSSLVAPAFADVRPPPLVHPVEKTPAQAKAWLLAANAVMKSGDFEAAEKLCDPRGYKDNLVGGSGNELESLFKQGHRKAWHLAADYDQTRKLRGTLGVILRTTVVDNESGKELDEVWVLLVKIEDADKATHWLALGAGEELAQVDALAARYLAKQPLAPEKAPEPAPE